MKRILIILIAIILVLLDNTILPYYFINQIYPSLLFVFIIAYSIVNGKSEAIFIGIVGGLLQDINFFQGFGVNLFLNTLICYACAKIGESIFKDNILIPAITVLGVSILKVLGVMIIFKLFSISINIYDAFISCILNTILMIIVYKFILKYSNKYITRDTWRF